MPQKSTETVHILEGQATLFRRPGTPHWHIRYKANGKWERTTTKETLIDSPTPLPFEGRQRDNSSSDV